MESDARRATAALHRPAAVHLIYIGSVRSQKKAVGVAKNRQSRLFALADFLASPGAKNVALAKGNRGLNSSNATIVTPVGSSHIALCNVNHAATWFWRGCSDVRDGLPYLSTMSANSVLQVGVATVMATATPLRNEI